MSGGDARNTRSWLVAIALFAAIASAMRIHNALHLGIGWGYDSVFHWAYVEQLLSSGFALPHPESGWSMSRPPLFFFASAALLETLGRSTTSDADVYRAFVSVRIASSAIGLVAIGLCIALVRRLAPRDGLRVVIAAGLSLFLPVHLYMSAMFNEEVLLASLITCALCATAWHLLDPAGGRRGVAFATAIGVAAGLAVMTKLTGVLVAAAVVTALLADGWRRGALGQALVHSSIISALVVAIGGWFYLHNLAVYGYLWPYSLGVHQIMLDMPPGERSVLDYFYIPFATFFDARAIQGDLQHSIWGTTYAGFWYDSHRHFVPALHTRARSLGAVILLLALVPTAAYLTGMLRGARRVLSGRGALDLLWLAVTALTVIGYVAYTWRNPWYATVKSSYLLGLLLPFSVYTSEVLSEWVTAPRPIWLRRGVAAALIVLLVCVVCAFTFETFLWDRLFGPAGFPNVPELPKPMRQ